MLPMLALIAHLKWTSVIVIYDTCSEPRAMELQQNLSTIGTYTVMYKMENMTSDLIDDLSNVPNKKAEGLNFIVLCSLEAFDSFMRQPFNYDRQFVWRQSLLHTSKWLVGVLSKEAGDLDISKIEFDNVAVIKYSMNGTSLCQQGNLTWIPIETLLWVQCEGRCRDLSIVGYITLEGQIIHHQNIYPNTKFGFNGRRLIVSTISSYPFVDYDNKTNTYSGIAIQLLQQLAGGLNFTYQLIGPPDNSWGAEISDNVWNGMVGQLQRKEVDIVATALTVSSQRETVMDFTHPYYYEVSSMIIKKPDSQSGRWRKLLDPFSPTVFLCIGISLPVISFLLFIFEKNNPYYRKIRREKIRGLHHFSDSFWYIYGSLLTHGGEHIAKSSSGRTLLSCWWIFCIVTVASYSGNFVASLAITKETLPFQDLEGLVAQDVYKWGTAGASFYETIFSNTDVPERKAFWQGVVNFNKSDTSVLNDNINHQVGKALEGNYAFIWDNVPLEFAAARSCDLETIHTDIFSTYAIGLPENSPFLKVFSDRVIAVLESGLIELWMSQVWPKSESCGDSTMTTAKTISLLDIQIGFYSLAVGISFASIILLAEVLKNIVSSKKCTETSECGNNEENSAINNDVKKRVSFCTTEKSVTFVEIEQPSSNISNEYTENCSCH